MKPKILHCHILPVGIFLIIVSDINSMYIEWSLLCECKLVKQKHILM